MVGVEIYQQACSQSHRAQVGHQLRAVNGLEAFDRFQLDDDDVLYHQAHSVPMDDFIAVTNLDHVLGRIAETLMSQLNHHRLVIHGLDVTSTKSSVHGKRAADDLVNDVFNGVR